MLTCVVDPSIGEGVKTKGKDFVSVAEDIFYRRSRILYRRAEKAKKNDWHLAAWLGHEHDPLEKEKKDRSAGASYLTVLPRPT
jgi:hypothetical protein